MNFSQLHERLRIEVLRRIENGSLSAALLAHRTGFVPAHISNFLNCKRRLSLDALDKVLRSESLTVADLFPEDIFRSNGAVAAIYYDSVPLVDQAVAALNLRIRSEQILDVVKVRNGLLSSLRDKCSAQRRTWDRFVAVRIAEEDAAAMQPDLRANATLLIDRHYNSTIDYAPDLRTIYAVRQGNRIRFRYVTLVGRQLVLSARDPAHSPQLLPLAAGQNSADLLVGRVFLVIAEL
jgi:hypothetical protein